MMKPYFVELKVSAVVMASSEIDALCTAEMVAREIVFDSELIADTAVELNSLADLKRLDHELDGDCIPYGGDEKTPLKNLLPEEAPFRDTRTIDMFATA